MLIFIRINYCSRFNRFKVSFIYFCQSGKFIAFIPGTRGHPNLLHHKPNWLISLKAKLSLHFLCRNAFLGRGHQVNSDKPIAEGKISRFHYGCATQGGKYSAIFTLKLFNRFHQVMGSPFTISTNNALFLTMFPKIISATLFIGKLFEKTYKLHNHYFDSKLLRSNETYLRFGT